MSPSSATVATNGTQQFTAAVMGTGAFNTAVTWSVNGVFGGTLGGGMINASGVYTAPSFAPTPNTVTISATSVQDTTKSGMAQSIITGVAAGPTSISISPLTAALGPAMGEYFTATVQGNGVFNESVNWSVNGTTGGNANVGTIDSGSYVSPSNISGVTSVTVTATTVATPTLSASATVTLAGMPTITSISPSQGVPGDVLQISGIDLGTLTQTVVFSGPNGLAIAQQVSQGGPTFLSVVVPLEAATGPLFVQVPSSNGTSINSNGLTFTRVPDLRIRAPKNDLGAGEEDDFSVTIFGSSAMQTISWSTNLGTITNDGVYQAPASVPSDTFATVVACIQGTQTCDNLLLGLHPFRTDPAAPTAVLGGSVQLQGLTAGMPVSATWSQVTGYGTLAPNGEYTAPSVAADGGSTLVSAAYQGIQEQTSVGVTGGFPGLVNRVYDYLNLTTVQIQRVTNAASVAVSGTRAYVLSAQDDSAGFQSNIFYIDVYDLTDPVHPAWIAAAEATGDGQLYAYGGFLYDVDTSTAIPESSVGSIGVYDVSGTTPALIARQTIMTSSSWSFNAGVFTVEESTQSSYAAGASGLVDQFYLVGTNLTERQISIPPPIADGYAIATEAATQDRLYVTVQHATATTMPGVLATYDITSNPATLLGVLTLPEDVLLSSGVFITSSYLVTDQKVFDITQGPPTGFGSLPEPINVIGGDATQILANTQQTGLRVIDVSDPANPQTFASLSDRLLPRAQGALTGNYVYAAERTGGLAVYDVSAPGGQEFVSQLMNQGQILVSDQVGNATTLYVSGTAEPFSGFNVYNLQVEPPSQLSSTSTPSDCNALALQNNDLFVGTDQALLVFDVSQPSKPSQIGSVNTSINSLALSGNFLFAGTEDDRLAVFNVSSPGAPTSIASVNLPDTALQIAISGSLLLIADRTGGLLVFNVSVPSSPALVSQLTVAPAVFGVQADGNLALLAVLETGLVIVDLTVPSNPQISSQTALDSYDPFDSLLIENRAATIAIQNKIAFIGVDNFDTGDTPNNANGTVYGFDYTQPKEPRLVSLAAWAGTIEGGITSLYSTGTSLFVAGFQNTGLTQVNISQPRNTINLFYPPAALRPPFTSPPPVPSFRKYHGKPTNVRRSLFKPVDGQR